MTTCTIEFQFYPEDATDPMSHDTWEVLRIAIDDKDIATYPLGLIPKVESMLQELPRK